MLSLAREALLLCPQLGAFANRALAEVSTHLVDLEGRLPGSVLRFLAKQFHPLTGFQRLVLLVCKRVGLLVLFGDEFVSVASHTALQLRVAARFPVDEACANSCTGCDASDHCTFIAIARG